MGPKTVQPDREACFLELWTGSARREKVTILFPLTPLLSSHLGASAIRKWKECVSKYDTASGSTFSRMCLIVEALPPMFGDELSEKLCCGDSPNRDPCSVSYRTAATGTMLVLGLSWTC